MTDSRLFSPCYLMIILLTTTMLCSDFGPAQAREIDRVVAVVNDEVITRTELDKATAGIFSQIRQNIAPAELEEALSRSRRQILDNLIDELLISQKAAELHISISETELDSAVASIAGENSMTVAELQEEMARTGVTMEDYRKKLRTQILHSKLMNYEIRSKTVISVEKARTYYDTVYSQQKTAPGYHLLQFGLTWTAAESSAETKEKVRQKAEGLRKLADSGQNFQELARSFSEMPSAKDGGDLGFFKGDELAGYMKEIITGLQPGQISEIIETENSYQFFQLVARNINGTTEFAPFDDISEEIINLLRKEELDKRYKKWMTEIKDQAIIKELL